MPFCHTLDALKSVEELKETWHSNQSGQNQGLGCDAEAATAREPEHPATPANEG